MSDKNIKCIDCGEIRVFTENEQDFYREKEFKDPKRCKNCSAKKKVERASNETRDNF